MTKEWFPYLKEALKLLRSSHRDHQCYLSGSFRLLILFEKIKLTKCETGEKKMLRLCLNVSTSTYELYLTNWFWIFKFNMKIFKSLFRNSKTVFFFLYFLLCCTQHFGCAVLVMSHETAFVYTLAWPQLLEQHPCIPVILRMRSKIANIFWYVRNTWWIKIFTIINYLLYIN